MVSMNSMPEMFSLALVEFMPIALVADSIPVLSRKSADMRSMLTLAAVEFIPIEVKVQGTFPSVADLL